MAGANSIDVQSLASTLFQVYLGLYLETTLNTTDGDNLVQGMTYLHVVSYSSSQVLGFQGCCDSGNLWKRIQEAHDVCMN
jgi:hypothetical protein